jgi:hypothetical protein
MSRDAIKDHKDLEIYKMAFDAAMKILTYQKVSRRGAVFANGSDSVSFEICLRTSS